MNNNSIEIRTALAAFGIPYHVSRTANGDVVTAPTDDNGENVTVALWAARVDAIVLPAGTNCEIIPA